MQLPCRYRDRFNFVMLLSIRSEPVCKWASNNHRHSRSAGICSKDNPLMPLRNAREGSERFEPPRVIFKPIGLLLRAVDRLIRLHTAISAEICVHRCRNLHSHPVRRDAVPREEARIPRWRTAEKSGPRPICIGSRQGCRLITTGRWRLRRKEERPT